MSEVDLIVVGSGTGGLSAAVNAAARGLRVVLLERAGGLGGTTAWSGGWIWAPDNPVAARAGAPIQGLWAAGTDNAGVFGGFYPAGGINLGPAMTFGSIAGQDAAGEGAA